MMISKVWRGVHEICDHALRDHALHGHHIRCGVTTYDGHAPRDHARRSHRMHGHAAIELICSGFFLFVFAVLSADICIVLFGAYQNDRACRDAARSAAQGQDAAQSTKLANAALKAHAGDGYYFSNPVLDAVIVYDDFGGTPPAGTSPFVKVATRTTARVPFSPLRFTADAVFLDGGAVTFKQSYTFPIVRTK